MKIVKKIILSVLFVIILFLLASILIMHFYGKEVTRHILSEISKKINVEIHVSTVEDISIFRKFPFASMTLLDVMIKESTKKTDRDTLLYLKKIYLQFSIIDIVRKDYKIKRISLADGFLNLKVNKKGRENYMEVFQTRESVDGNKDEESFLLKLSRMNVSGFTVFYSNAIKKQDFKILCEDVTLKGNFSNDEFLMNISGDLFTEQFKIEEIGFFEKRGIEIKTEIAVNKQHGYYSLNTGEIIIDKNTAFEITGNIRSNEDKTFTDLKISGKNLDIASSLDLLPGNYIGVLLDYESQGKISFDCRITGALTNEQTPEISAEFKVENGSLKQKNTSYSFSSINLNGTFTNGKLHNSSTTLIDVKGCSASLCLDGNPEPAENLKAGFIISNLSNPLLKLSAIASFDMNKLAKFFAIDTVENISGMADFNINYEGVLKSKEEYSASDFRNSKTSGIVRLQNVNFMLKQSRLSYENFSGSLVLQNNDMLIKDVKGNISSTDFAINGLFRNALAYMFLPDEKLTVEAVFTSENLNLNELLGENESKDTSYLLVLPNHVNFNLNADVGNLSFRKFTAKDLSGIITITNKTLSSDNIYFKTMDGTVTGSLEIDASSNRGIIISSEALISSIDINKLFFDFENFGQNVITDSHLKGIATANVLFSMKMDSALIIDENMIHSIVDLTIDQGELINYEPMNEISGYIKNHIFLKRIIKGDEFEKKLKHIRFSTLKNQIRIKDNKVIIPAMIINTSALNIETEGSHTFDHAIDYRFNFFLSELLMKKEDVSQDEFGEIEDDGSGKKNIFLTIKGTLDDPIISYDKKKVKKNVAEEVLQEKKILKGILKEEFGWFKNDSSAVKTEKRPKKEFVIEWEEQNPSNGNEKEGTDSTHSPKSKTDIKEKNIMKLLDKLGKEDEKKEENFEFEKSEDF